MKADAVGDTVRDPAGDAVGDPAGDAVGDAVGDARLRSCDARAPESEP